MIHPHAKHWNLQLHLGSILIQMLYHDRIGSHSVHLNTSSLLEIHIDILLNLNNAVKSVAWNRREWVVQWFHNQPIKKRSINMAGFRLQTYERSRKNFIHKIQYQNSRRIVFVNSCDKNDNTREFEYPNMIMAVWTSFV